jgi:hypothetical protein
MTDAKKFFPVENLSPVYDAGPDDFGHIIFYHVGKSGGSSFNMTLRAVINNIGVKGLHIRDVDAANIDETAFIWGHETAGVHLSLSKSYTYATLLREPVTRFASIYYHWSQEHFKGEVDHELMQGKSLEQWIDADPRFMSQVDWLSSKFDGRWYGDEALDVARKNLTGYFAFVGITEMQEESLFLCCDRFGWPSVPLWDYLYATEGRPDLADMSLRLRRKIERLVEPDLELYHDERRKFENLFKRSNFGESFREYMRDMERSPAQEAFLRYRRAG